MMLSNLLSYTVQAGVLLAVGLMAPRVLRLRAPSVALGYWQALLAALLMLPILQPWHHTAGDAATVQIVGVMVARSLAATAPEGEAGRAMWWIAAAVGGVAALRLMWVGLGLWTLGRIRRGARRIDRVPESVLAIQKRLGVDAEILESSRVQVPVTFGWLRPVVLVPPRFESLPQDQQQGVVCHELLHVGRGDWLMGMAEQIARSVLWFHPGVSILLDRIALTREQLVDSEVVRLTGDRRSYLDSLWLLARRSERPSAAAALPLLNRSDLFERVAVLTEEVKMSKQRTLTTLAAVIVSVALAGVAAAAAFPLVRGAAPAPLAALEPVDGSLRAAEPGPSPMSSAGPEPVRFEPDGEVTEPRPIHKVNPKYPEEARKNRITGVVVCETVITSEGRISDVKIVRTADEVFNQPTIDALTQWEFEPATLDGQPVDVYYVLTIKYSLSKDKPKAEE
jgi:TonB family protein